MISRQVHISEFVMTFNFLLCEENKYLCNPMYNYTILILFKHNGQEFLLTWQYTNHVMSKGCYLSVDHNHNKIKMSVQDRDGF